MFTTRCYLPCFVFILWISLGLLHIGAADDDLIVDKPVTENCLECLCEAKSNCNATKICVNGACGIFRITWGYWTEGGSLTLPNDTSLSEEAFTNCVNDPICAAETIQKYMYKYGQDCNGDGRIDCLDFGALHKMGNLRCQDELPYTFGRIFHKCLKRKERDAKSKESSITK
ncbi:lysozyme 3 isoform X2 [Drosophila grimshawi]|uniref:lysozyme 3 isoform X2 n=1 Tax=Drosophila grimshawi TaxID=7222 RepID=UPI000C870D02|nr:lysozyme 3 isoform X2 [Drosophila grimshawi]